MEIVHAIIPRAFFSARRVGKMAFERVYAKREKKQSDGRTRAVMGQEIKCG